jgi:hypothetical protein
MADAQGYLLFLREVALLAQPFDARRPETTGDAFPIAEQIQYILAVGKGVFSIADHPRPELDRRLKAINSEGREPSLRLRVSLGIRLKLPVPSDKPTSTHSVCSSAGCTDDSQLVERDLIWKSSANCQA